jgi:hypothetical protein
MNVRCWLIAAALLSATPLSAADHQTDYAALKARATTVRTGDQGKVYAQIAFHGTEVANDQYTAGDVTKAQATIDEVVSYAQKARDAARRSNKNLKQTEITLRETSRRLEEVRRSIAVEDRPYVETAINQVEGLRKELLEQMFGPKTPRDTK